MGRGVSDGGSDVSVGRRLGVDVGAGVGAAGCAVGVGAALAPVSGLCRSLTTIGRKRLGRPDAGETPAVASTGSVAVGVNVAVGRLALVGITVLVGVTVLVGTTGVVGIGVGPVNTWGFRATNGRESPVGEDRPL